MSRPTVEEYLAEWLKQPGTFVTEAERRFIDDMRKAAVHGVGYGWMQSIIEVEWKARVPVGGWGPSFFEQRIDELEAELKWARRIIQHLREWRACDESMDAECAGKHAALEAIADLLDQEGAAR